MKRTRSGVVLLFPFAFLSFLLTIAVGTEDVQQLAGGKRWRTMFITWVLPVFLVICMRRMLPKLPEYHIIFG